MREQRAHAKESGLFASGARSWPRKVEGG